MEDKLLVEPLEEWLIQEDELDVGEMSSNEDDFGMITASPPNRDSWVISWLGSKKEREFIILLLIFLEYKTSSASIT